MYYIYRENELYLTIKGINNTMRRKYILAIIGVLLLSIVNPVVSQTHEAYDEKEEEKGKGIFDPSRLKINHAISFGMFSSSQTSGLKSQSLYTTMMTYKFSQPVTLNVNFGFPIHSTFSSEMNFNPDNIESLEYFKNMPIDASLLWQPSEKFAMQIRVVRNPAYYSPFASPYFSPFGYIRNW